MYIKLEILGSLRQHVISKTVQEKYVTYAQSKQK